MERLSIYNTNLSQTVNNPRQSGIGNKTSIGSLCFKIDLGKKELKFDESSKKQNIEKIYSHLIKNEFGYDISPKILSTPSTQTFTRVFSFIFHSFKQNLVVPDKYSPEFFMQALKSIGYPYKIQKSILSCHSGTLSWHYSLATIVWMIETLEDFKPFLTYATYKSEQPAKTANIRLTALADEIFKQSVSTNYICALKKECYNQYQTHGHNENMNPTYIKFKTDFENNRMEELKGLENDTKMLDKEQVSLQIRVQAYDRLDAKRQETEEETQALDLYQQKLAAHLAILIENQCEKHEHICGLRNALEKTERECLMLEKQVQNQKYNKQDLEKLQGKRLQLLAENKSLEEYCAQLKLDRTNIDTKSATLVNLITQHCTDYNLKIGYKFGHELEIGTQNLIEPISNNAEYPSALKNGINLFQQACETELNKQKSLECDSETVKDKLEKLNNEKVQLEKGVEILESRVNHAKSECDKAKDTKLEYMKNNLVNKDKLLEKIEILTSQVKEMDVLIKENRKMKEDAKIRFENYKKEYYEFLKLTHEALMIDENRFELAKIHVEHNNQLIEQEEKFYESFCKEIEEEMLDIEREIRTHLEN